MMMRRDLATLCAGLLLLGGCEGDAAKPTATAEAKAPAPAASETKASETKASETKASETKASETKASETKASVPTPVPTPVEAAPVPPPTPTPGAAPAGPVLMVVGEDGEAKPLGTAEPEDGMELELDLRYETIGGVHVDMAAADVLAKLGKPKKQSKARTQGATGDREQTWSYDGLEITMRGDPRKGKQEVDALQASSGCTLPASWGLRIGSTRAEVEKVYAKAIVTDLSGPDEVFAGSPYAGVSFGLTDDAVTRISIGRAE